MAKINSISIMFIMLLTACVHKIDIQQGNVVTAEMLENISIGMESEQIMNIIGTPLVVDAFRNDRWEYVYSMVLGGSKKRQFSYITLHFKGNKLDDVEIHTDPIKEADIKTLARKSKRNI